MYDVHLHVSLHRRARASGSKMYFVYMHSSLASQTPTAQNIVRQASALSKKMAVSYFCCLSAAFVLLGADWLDCWVCEAWIGASC